MNGLLFPIKMSRREAQKAAAALITFSHEMVELERSAQIMAKQTFIKIRAWRNLNFVPLKAWIHRNGVAEQVKFEKSTKLIIELLSK
jgi:hypothetical protein